MAIALNTILTWCRAPVNTRAAITASLMPDGLSDLGDFSIEEIKDAVKTFARLGIVRIAKEDTKTNLSDLFTKPLNRARRNELLDAFMY